MIDFNRNSEQGEKSILDLNISRRRMIALFKISQRINQIDDLQTLLEEIIHSAITLIGAERGMIVLADESGENYRTVASESLKDEDVTFSRSIVKVTLENREIIISADLESDLRFKDVESARKLRILSFISVPLVLPGQNIAMGTLYIDSRISIKTFSREDAAFLESFANLAAVAINNAKLMDSLFEENIELRQEVGKKYEFPGIIGYSKAMQKVFKKMKYILNDNCTVLLTGESGSGKEVIARAIHDNGNRREYPFLAINCGALPETLLESELFGSVKGAFTGAVDRQGLLQASDGGTLFLDEIHHMSEALQIKLLRFLQDREFRKVGGTRNISVYVRLICSTNEDLQSKIDKGEFRQDFFYRINIVTIYVPPLRERQDDVPALAHHFLEKFAEEKGEFYKDLEEEALELLVNYDWIDNNVRELENELERATIFSGDASIITIKDLSDKFRSTMPVVEKPLELFIDNNGLPLTYHEFEKKYINFILEEVDGNRARAARVMNINYSTLRGKMRKLKLIQ